jgi:positive regulator of sigma E activity
MDRSLFLARLMGPTFVVIALGMLINLGTYESMIAEALHTGILFYLSGLLSLLAGLAIVNLHNMWCADWRVIVTVLGWLMTIGGIIRIVLPQVAIAIGSTIYGGRAATIVVALIVGTLGAFLSLKGYVRRT